MTPVIEMAVKQAVSQRQAIDAFKCFFDPENHRIKKPEFRQAGTGVPERSPE